MRTYWFEVDFGLAVAFGNGVGSERSPELGAELCGGGGVERLRQVTC